MLHAGRRHGLTEARVTATALPPIPHLAWSTGGAGAARSSPELARRGLSGRWFRDLRMGRPCSPGFPNSENSILSGVMTHDDSERTPKNARKQAHRTTRMRPTIPTCTTLLNGLLRTRRCLWRGSW